MRAAVPHALWRASLALIGHVHMSGSSGRLLVVAASWQMRDATATERRGGAATTCGRHTRPTINIHYPRRVRARRFHRESRARRPRTGVAKSTSQGASLGGVARAVRRARLRLERGFIVSHRRTPGNDVAR